MSIVRIKHSQNKPNIIQKGTLLSLVNGNNFRCYNIIIARALGSVHAAIMLSELIQRYEYHQEKNELITSPKNEGLWFYYTQEKCEERTMLSEREQRASLSILENLGIINKCIIGVPGKRHFQIVEEKIIQIIDNSKKISRSCETSDLDPAKRQTRSCETSDVYSKENEEENQEEKYKDEQRITKESGLDESNIVDRESSFDLKSNSFSEEEQMLNNKIDRLGNLKFLDDTPIKKITVMRWLLKFSFEDIDNALKYYFKVSKLGQKKIKKHEAYVETILKNRYWEIQATKDYVESNLKMHEKRKLEDEQFWEKRK